MAHRLDRVVRAALSEPWAIHQPKFEMVIEVLSRRLAGERLETHEIQQAIQEDASKSHMALRGSVSDGGRSVIAVIPIHGIIAHRMNMVNNASGPMGTSIEWLRSAFRAAETDPTVKSILLEVDSPGGTVSLVDEMAAEIRRANTRVVAQVNDFAASAGYYLASAADEVVVTPSGQLGSIGVYATHTDVSTLAEAEGVKTTLISAGEGKTDGNEFEPLSDRARDNMQRRVNAFYDMFVNAVVAGRNLAFQQADKRTSRSKQAISASIVRDEWKADLFMADEAVAIGMADRVATIHETVERMAGELQRADRSARAEAEDEIRLRAGRRARVMARCSLA